MRIRALFFVFTFLFVVTLAHAGDERSIKDLAKALTALGPDVDPAEAQPFPTLRLPPPGGPKKNNGLCSTLSLRYSCTTSACASAAGVGIGRRTSGPN